MKNYRVAIIEDNDGDFERLDEQLKRYGTENDVAFSVKRFSYGELFLENYKPVYDMIFMDIELLGMDGMKSAERLRELDKYTVLIFVTNLQQYAIRGYSVNATDFVLKPINYYSLKIKLAGVLNKIDVENKGTSICIRNDVGTQVVMSRDIYYIEIVGHDITCHTADTDITFHGSLVNIERKLAPYGFCRSCSWSLVNMKYISGIYGDEIEMLDGKRLHISRGKRKAFLEAFNDFSVGE